MLLKLQAGGGNKPGYGVRCMVGAPAHAQNLFSPVRARAVTPVGYRLLYRDRFSLLSVLSVGPKEGAT